MVLFFEKLEIVDQHVAKKYQYHLKHGVHFPKDGRVRQKYVGTAHSY